MLIKLFGTYTIYSLLSPCPFSPLESFMGPIWIILFGTIPKSYEAHSIRYVISNPYGAHRGMLAGVLINKGEETHNIKANWIK